MKNDEVSARTEYVERKAAIAFMNKVEPCICHDPDGVVFTATKDSSMLEFLRAIPAADVVPVRHGRWINICGDRESPRQCSECLQDFDYIDGICYLVSGQRLPQYCPNCGARMDKGGDGDVPNV